MKKFLLMLALVAICCACGTQDSGVSQAETGSILLRAQWPPGEENPQIHKAPAGVVTVRVIVSGPDMTDLLADFDATLNRGTIQHVKAGSERMVTVQGLDDAARITHTGFVDNVTVLAGQTTDVGTVQLNVAAVGLWDRSRWDQALWGQ